MIHEELCGKDGTSRIHVERKHGAQCVLDFAPQNLIDEGYFEDSLQGVYYAQNGF